MSKDFIRADVFKLFLVAKSIKWCVEFSNANDAGEEMPYDKVKAEHFNRSINEELFRVEHLLDQGTVDFFEAFDAENYSLFYTIKKVQPVIEKLRALLIEIDGYKSLSVLDIKPVGDKLSWLKTFYMNNVFAKPKAKYREHVKDYMESLSIDAGQKLIEEWGFEGRELEDKMIESLKSAVNHERRARRKQPPVKK